MHTGGRVKEVQLEFKCTDVLYNLVQGSNPGNPNKPNCMNNMQYIGQSWNEKRILAFVSVSWSENFQTLCSLLKGTVFRDFPPFFVFYADKQISNFVLEYLRNSKKVHETVLACSYVVQVEFFELKIEVEIFLFQFHASSL